MVDCRASSCTAYQAIRLRESECKRDVAHVAHVLSLVSVSGHVCAKVKKCMDQRISARNSEARKPRQDHQPKAKRNQSAFQENAVSGKRKDSSQEETLVVSATMRINVEKQRDRPLVLQNRRRKAMVYFIRRREPSEANVRLVKDLEERTKTTSVENARDSWHAPVCQNYKTESDANSVTSALLYAQRV